MPKRSLPRSSNERSKKGQAAVDLNWDDNIESSDDDDDENEPKLHSDDSSESEEELTVEQQRKKIAQEYLANMKTVDSSDSSDDDTPSGLSGNTKLSHKLTQARLENQGKFFSEISESIGSYVNESSDIVSSTYNGHQSTVTCVALSSDDSTIYSGSKDNSVIRWDAETGAKMVIKAKWSRKSHGTSQSHEGEVLSVAISSDMRYLASGGRDNLIRIYDTRLSSDRCEVQVFSGHRDAVTSLAFQKDSYSLFSGSSDRCIKHWDLNEMGYLETLFGHQDAVNSLDCWTKERPLSSSADRSVRMWKVSDDSHLVFRGHKASIDNVQYLTPESYISSGQDGSLCVWKESQKKPSVHCDFAHGREQGGAGGARWITALAACKMTDFVATGSHDGFIRLWHANAEDRALNETSSLPVDGFVNSIALSKRLLVAGVGSEHRLGRWWRLKNVKNYVKIIRLPNCSGVSRAIEDLSDKDCQDGDDSGTDDQSSDHDDSS